MKYILLSLILLLTACTPKAADEKVNTTQNIVDTKEDNKSTDTSKNDKETDVKTDENLDNQTAEVKEGSAQKVDISLKPNEAGKIMVLMYHNIGTEEEEWVRTPENFKKDLETLYEKGYIPISLKDYVSGNIHTPAGKTPYVLTFDDTNENNFRYLSDGSIDPNCAVGILLEFAKKHPDVKPYCTFFGNGEIPFRVTGQEKEKVNFLIKNHMDLGNHTVNHPDLTEMKPESVLYEVGRQAKYLTSLFDGNYEVNTLALPFGSRPTDSEAEAKIFSGEYEGFNYKNIAVLNVGWDPYFSPYHTEFNPHHIHRIRASEIHVDGVGLYDWLKHFDENPEARFISDGFPNIVTIKSDAVDQITNIGERELFIY
ncbi:polysaccharide deacetylase family protein [Microaceticoccus formicicus]|uniref:polysaccharide deacetylase family protein n=1 Tax=Microaceticoccus formicicus TaxID=3118105 RepID=UPI003CD00BC3|nr:polysaccharide deacetylase family protein [Peptoniphilaceae bacterium AMB_02]